MRDDPEQVRNRTPQLEFSKRTAVIIDTLGTVRFVKVYPIGEAPDTDELLQALKEL